MSRNVYICCSFIHIYIILKVRLIAKIIWASIKYLLLFGLYYSSKSYLRKLPCTCPFKSGTFKLSILFCLHIPWFTSKRYLCGQLHIQVIQLYGLLGERVLRNGITLSNRIVNIPSLYHQTNHCLRSAGWLIRKSWCHRWASSLSTNQIELWV